MNGRGARVAPVLAGVVVLAVGLVLLFVGSSSGVQIAGLVVAVLAGAYLLVGPLASSGVGMAWVNPRLTAGRPGRDSEHDASGAEYVEENPPATEQDWEHERELYERKERQGESES